MGTSLQGRTRRALATLTDTRIGYLVQTIREGPLQAEEKNFEFELASFFLCVS